MEGRPLNELGTLAMWSRAIAAVVVTAAGVGGRRVERGEGLDGAPGRGVPE